MVTAIVGLAHSLDLEVVAEGVENPEQLEFLRTLGCEEIQGYLSGRPLSADQFEKLLTRSDEKPFLRFFPRENQRTAERDVCVGRRAACSRRQQVGCGPSMKRIPNSSMLPGW